MNLNNGYKKADSKRIAYDVLEGLKHTSKDETILLTLSAAILTLHEDNPNDKWGKNRLARFIQSVDKRIDEMETYTPEQIKNRVKAKTGKDLR